MIHYTFILPDYRHIVRAENERQAKEKVCLATGLPEYVWGRTREKNVFKQLGFNMQIIKDCMKCQ